MIIYGLIFLYAVNLLTSEERESYENIYRSTHPSNTYVCIACNCVYIKNRRSVMSLYDQMKTSTSFDSWLTTDTREYYDEDAVEERVKELTSIGGKYDYRTFDAMYDMITSLTAEQGKQLEVYLADPVADMAQFGRLIKCLIIEDCEKIAEAQARREQDEE